MSKHTGGLFRNHEDFTTLYLADLNQEGADSAMDEMFGGGR